MRDRQLERNSLCEAISALAPHRPRLARGENARVQYNHDAHAPVARRYEMAERFQVGDQVTWNSEAGPVSGTIVAIHTTDFSYKGHLHHASKDDPQYEIKSKKTDHIAAHKGSALKHAAK
jgi:hypothetical protein